jgi:GAF domain-containing protein
MSEVDLNFYKVLFEDLDPDNLKKRFLELLLTIQNVERGSLWVKRNNKYVCIESLGSEFDTDIIKGAGISVDQPSIVGWVVENAQMTIAEPGKDPRHFKEFEGGMKLKSTRILCFPLILEDGEVYGAVQVIDTSPGGKRIHLDERFLKLLKSIVDMGSIALSHSLKFTRQVERNLELERILERIRDDVEIIGQSRPFLDVTSISRCYEEGTRIRTDGLSRVNYWRKWDRQRHYCNGIALPQFQEGQAVCCTELQCHPGHTAGKRTIRI